jgi:hypothetical protein
VIRTRMRSLFMAKVSSFEFLVSSPKFRSDSFEDLKLETRNAKLPMCS